MLKLPSLPISGTSSCTKSYTDVEQNIVAPPTEDELKNMIVTFEDDGGQKVRVSPVTILRRPVERYLPPSGDYYDQNTILASFDADMLSNEGRCVSCWSHKHVASLRDCASSCLICHTKKHLGKECNRIFATVRWWKAHGHTPPAVFSTRPQASTLAYLIVAQIVMPMKLLQDAVVPNMRHPIVKKFYGTQAPPHAIGAAAQKCGNVGKPVEMALETSATVASSLACEYDGDHEVEAPLHHACKSRIQNLQFQLVQARKNIASQEQTIASQEQIIAARDVRIAELDGILNGMDAMMGGQRGRKRMKTGDVASDTGKTDEMCE
jgi:hypothetical protein